MNNMIISSSPHIKSGATTQKIMLDVIIALCPALIASVVIFGFRALIVTLTCVSACVLSEFVFRFLCKREMTIMDLSAVVTGMLLAFNLPVSIPYWQAVLGSVFAIVMVKQVFGGIGHNFANPAIATRVMMLLAFSGTMTNWAVNDSFVDLVSGATPLAVETAQELPTKLNMFLGLRGGCLGETCGMALVLGFIYLIIRKVITWQIPVVFVATVFVLAFVIKGDFDVAVYQVLSGGLLIGAIFMATDYSTSPHTSLGKIIFAVGCGLLTVLIRFYGNYPEGVSFAILFMNILTPYISKYTSKKPFGGVVNA